MELGKSIPVLLTLITAIAALWSAAFLTGKLSPNIDLLLRPVWLENELVKLVIQVKNSGSIRIRVDEVLLALKCVPTRKQSAEKIRLLGSEWLSFGDSEHIMTSSKYINPNEIIHVEHLYILPERSVVHAGIQVYLKYPWYIRILGGQARSTRQTRVYYFSSSEKDDSKQG